MGARGARRTGNETRTTKTSTAESRPRRGLGAELASAVTPRAALLMLGVLALQLAFIASYIGAFHQPTPHRIPITVVAPERAQADLARQLNALDDEPLDVTSSTTDREAAERRLRDREVDGVLVVDPAGERDTLLVASGAGTSAAQALEDVVGRVEESQGRQLRTEDVVPASDHDSGGLASFYLAIGWCIGGYLCAAVLAMSYGARPSTVRRALVRLATIALSSVVGGIGGAVIAGPVLGAMPGSVLKLAALGALTGFAVGAATLALQTLVGVVGVGLSILLIVVLGNPSAGGAYAAPLLPSFWRDIGSFLPPGASTWNLRSVAYFDDAAMGGPLLVLGVWALVGVVLSLLFTVRHRRRALEEERGPAWARLSR